MTDVMTDDSASAEPVNTPEYGDDALPQTLDAQDDGDGIEVHDDDETELPDGDEGDGLTDYTAADGKTYRVPAEVKDGLMLKADHTRKTMEVAEQRKALAARDTQIQQTAQRQSEFAGQIAQLGALNAQLAPFVQVQDWPSYIRQGGAAAQADYAEYQALTNQRDQFARNLGAQVQQRAADEQRETVEQIEAGRKEIAKHIRGFSPETLDKLTAFAAPFGFSPDEIRQAEADPRSIRILHLAHLGQQALAAQKRTSSIAQSQRTQPVNTLRGAGGRIAARPDTDDFAAFEKLADQTLKARR